MNNPWMILSYVNFSGLNTLPSAALLKTQTSKPNAYANAIDSYLKGITARIAEKSLVSFYLLKQICLDRFLNKCQL